VKNRNLALLFIAIVATVAIVFSACKKINESTELGGNLIPPVDNINTFDTSLTVQAFNDTFGLANDTLYLARNQEFFLGKINSDPFFGKTDARMFLELKPPFYKFNYLDRPDSLVLDSIVLVLDYVETYGDTLTPQTINVYELDQANNFRSDTGYLIRKNDLTYSTLLGSRTIFPYTLNDSVKAYKDTTVNQLRIRLSDAFGNRVLDFDSIPNGAFASDSLFKKKLKGFALQSVGSGGAVMGFNLTGVNTKLAVYYRYLDGGGPASYDTTVTYLSFNSNCAAANFIQRDYSGTPLLASINNNPATPDPILYIQGNPGTFANLKIPALAGLSNRVVHRAELIVEQLYDISDSTYRLPDFLYLDAADPTIAASNYKFRTIPYDLTFSNTTGALNLGTFGVVPIRGIDAFGTPVQKWHFNISRYVQHVLNGTQSLYNLRLFAPFVITEQFGTPPGADQIVGVSVNQSIVKGRARLLGNNGPLDTNPHRIRLRIVYSKL